MNDEGPAHWAYRRAMRMHDFTDQHKELLDVILYFSLRRGVTKAIIPKQLIFEAMTGIHRTDVSRGLDWLEMQGAIERQPVEVVVSGRKHKWTAYALRPPASWRGVPIKIQESAKLAELEAWVDGLDPDKDLFPPPTSLNEALGETFVETSRDEALRPHSGLTPGHRRAETSTWNANSQSSREPGQAGVGDFPTPVGPVVGKNPTLDAVGKFPTQPPILENENSGSRDSRFHETEYSVLAAKSAQTDKRRMTRLDMQAYVEGRLFETIGNQERTGDCGRMWERAIRRMPDRLDALIGEGLDLKRTGGLRKTIGAWLNFRVYHELQDLDAKQRVGKNPH